MLPVCNFSIRKKSMVKLFTFFHTPLRQNLLTSLYTSLYITSMLKVLLLLILPTVRELCLDEILDIAEFLKLTSLLKNFPFSFSYII